MKNLGFSQKPHLMNHGHFIGFKNLVEVVDGLDIESKEIWFSIVSDHFGKLVQSAKIFHE